MFDDARRAAASVDSARRRGESLGLLAGAPTTIKECFHVAGTVATTGVARFAGNIALADGPLVARLRAAGAVVLGKTNLPQLMLMHETDSPVYGRASNPWNLERSPGGSSGGEAAIIAAGGSSLGLASDIGGSIRHPAHSCGVCGLKPTSGRLTNAGAFVNLRGMEAVVAQPGPIARRVEDLELAMRVLAAPGLERSDPQVAPVAWREPTDVRLSTLRVAMWTDDGYFGASPALRRAVRESAAALVERGVVVEEIAPPAVNDSLRLYFGLLTADGGVDALRLLGDGPVDRRIRELLWFIRMPRTARPAAAALAKLLGQRKMAELLGWLGARSADGYWRLTHERKLYQERFAAMLDHGRFDAVLCPPHALPALRHGGFRFLPTAASYCMLFNLLGMPAGVVPTTRVRADEESDRRPSRDVAERAAAETERGSAGLPVGVQIAARWWREDVVLRLMGELEAHFRCHPEYPQQPPLAD